MQENGGMLVNLVINLVNYYKHVYIALIESCVSDHDRNGP